MCTIAFTLGSDSSAVTEIGKLETSTTIVFIGFAAATVCARVSCHVPRPLFTRPTAARPSYVVGHFAHGAGFGSGGAAPHVGWLPTNTMVGPPAVAAVIDAAVAAPPLLSAT